MTMTEKDNAQRQAIAQYNSIKEMVSALRAARDSENVDQFEAAERAIHEDALSVELRSGWYIPGTSDADRAPAEFRILLCMGGPAVQIRGELNEHQEPVKAWIEHQDWFTPWTYLLQSEIQETSEEFNDYLLDYCGCFYFGE